MRNIGRIKDAASLLGYFGSLDLDLPFDEEVRTGPDAPLAKPLIVHGRTIGNRFAILPMEGWDCTADGRPSDPDPPALAALGTEWRQADLRRRSDRRLPGGPGQPQPAHHGRGDSG